MPAAGAASQGLRILRSRAEADKLHMTLEGLAGRSYTLFVRTPHKLGETSGVKVKMSDESDPELVVQFDGPSNTYVRRELTIPFTH